MSFHVSSALHSAASLGAAPLVNSDQPAWRRDAFSLATRLPLIVFSLMTLALLPAAKAHAQATETIVHSFNDGTVPGSPRHPDAPLIVGTDGNFYGTTFDGGSSGDGVVFQFTTHLHLNILHTFGDGSVADDGANPSGALVQGSDGDFYGTTQTGGSANLGTVFKITPAGTVTILHSFGDGSVANDGTGVGATITKGSDGNFYGTTQQGGSTVAADFLHLGYGIVFKITPSGAYTILHDFGDGSITNDGESPEGALIQATDGNFYGTTSRSSSTGDGTVFKITTSGAETVLHSFGDGTVADDGVVPVAALLQGPDGNFYGTTEDGGSIGFGTVFKITPTGTETVLYQFQGSPHDGAYPEAPLILSGGALYGTTVNGNTYGLGTIFTVSLAGGGGVFYNFQERPMDSANPTTAIVVGPDGNFWGTTDHGGIGNDGGHGTIYKISTSGVEAARTDFGQGMAPNDGSTPEAGLIQGSNGAFYGTTEYGGSTRATDPAGNGYGTVFTVSPNAPESVFYNFLGYSSQDGANPTASLLFDSSGVLYGTTSQGGSAGQGTVFKITPSATESVLHSFRDGSVANDGSYPEAPLVLGPDGNDYGTTIQNGSSGEGTVFKITPSGMETVLHSFGDGTVQNDGSWPSASLVLGNDGNFYGTTLYGGSTGVRGNSVSGYGTVFKITPTGTVTILHSFGDGSVANDGTSPGAALILGADGNFYGTTARGGSSADDGTVFKITPMGIVTILHRFSTDAYDGRDPESALVQGSDGNFYGTTVLGGSTSTPGGSGSIYDGLGTIFKITPVGTLTILHSFLGYPDDGSNPAAPLTPAGTGIFYGTTPTGGLNDAGTVYQTTLPGSAPKPVITGFSPASGAVGATVIITGTNLTGTTVVGFMGKHATSFTVNPAGTQITTTVPAGAQTGPIAVLTNGIEAKSATSFTVTAGTPAPTITGFTPASGSVGTTVVIMGTNLTGTTVVGFMGKHATSFTVNPAGTQITTTVPAGAQTGPIAVLTSGIEAKSATSFTVTP